MTVNFFDPKPVNIDLCNRLFELSRNSPSGIIRKIDRGPRKKGDKAGSLKRTGYYVVSINREAHFVHRVIFAMYYGIDPGGSHIDHIDGDIINNDPLNLRLATRPENNSNAIIRKDNTTGTKGLLINRRKNRRDSIVCAIKSNGKVFKKQFSIEKRNEAEEWIRNKRIELHGQFHNHGTKRDIPGERP